MAHAHEPGHEDHAPLHEGDDLPHHGPVLSEPRSPVWLPFLGAALAGLALVFWLSTPSDAEEAAAAAASASASAQDGEAAPPPAGEPAKAPPAPKGKVALPSGIQGKVAPTVDVNPNFKPKGH